MPVSEPMTNKIKIAFVLPENLQKEFKERVIKDGYEIKGKSRWVSESIEYLLSMGNYTELVKLSDNMKGFEKMESIIILQELKRKLENAMENVRKNYPMIEGVQSRILRTAIMQRLLLS